MTTKPGCRSVGMATLAALTAYINTVQQQGPPPNITAVQSTPGSCHMLGTTVRAAQQAAHSAFDTLTAESCVTGRLALPQSTCTFELVPVTPAWTTCVRYNVDVLIELKQHHHRTVSLRSLQTPHDSRSYVQLMGYNTHHNSGITGAATGWHITTITSPKCAPGKMLKWGPFATSATKSNRRPAERALAQLGCCRRLHKYIQPHCMPP